MDDDYIEARMQEIERAAEYRRSKGDDGFRGLHPMLTDWMSSDEANEHVLLCNEQHRRVLDGAADRVKAKRAARVASKEV
jgi:hypothetical protein